MDDEKKVDVETTQENSTTESELNIAEMSKEEITQAVEEGTLSVDDVVSYSEELEAQNKTKGDEKSQQILNDRLAKIDKLRNKPQVVKQETVPQQSDEIVVDDLITLREKEFAKDSDEAKVLKQFKDAGLIKDYQSGLEDVAVKAKLEAIAATRKAEATIDKNADEEVVLQTKNTIYDKYESTGKEPQSDYEKQVVVDKMLDKLDTA